MKRPTFDDLQAERAAFIGPPPPPQIPKLTPVAERDAVYQMMLRDLKECISEETNTWHRKQK